MKTILFFLVLFPALVLADTVRTSDGSSCSFDADDNPFKLKTYAEKEVDNYDSSISYNSKSESAIGVSLEYTFGGPKRLECDRLYQLELRDKEARVKELEARVAALEAVNSVDWDIFSK